MNRSLFFAAVLVASLAAEHAVAGQTQSQLTFRGTTTLARGAGAAATGTSGPEIHPGPEFDAHFERLAKGAVSPSRVPADHVPRPADSGLTGFTSGLCFDGLTHLDQRTASNGNQFSSEPPDQALAVSDKYVVEAVNTAIRVRDRQGNVLTSTIALNAFFGLAPSITRSTPPVYGPFTSDPRAYFDVDTQRWFVTLLEIDQDPATGNFGSKSSVLIAVSKKADPTGTWFLYSIDTTNVTGTPDHTGCPCFGDQPLIGADAFGFYITTNEFPIFQNGFNGAQVYAMSKTKLEAGLLGPVVAFSGLPLAESSAYTLQPAITAQGDSHAGGTTGTEYFLSALDFNATLDNRIAIWALTNTSSLDSATPHLTLQSSIIASQVYGQPPDVQQRPGPTPLADLIKSGAFGKAGTQALPLIAANDDRMQQVTWAHGKLWSSLNSVVKPANGTVQSGAAWFIVEPQWSNGALGGRIAKQGYVAQSGFGLVYPSIGVNSAGKGVMSFSIAGTSLYPSVGYVPIDDVRGTGAITLVALGTAPDDGFSGYPILGGDRAGRWGDYSAAVADSSGTIWFANEYIPNAPRTVLANWGTFIGRVTP